MARSHPRLAATVSLSLISLLLASAATGQVRRLQDILPGPMGSAPGALFTWKNHVYFGANDGKVGTELWRSNGKAGGTKLFANIAPDSSSVPSSSSPAHFVDAGNQLFFSASTPTLGRQVYVTDGKSTRMVRDLGRNGFSAMLGSLGGRLYFRRKLPRQGWALFVSDGTTAGTGWFDPFQFRRFDTRDFVRLGNRILFATDVDAQYGNELYISTGTVTGTTLLKDIYPGSRGSYVTGLTVIGSRCYFSAIDPKNGRELWVTDGKPGGTRRIADIWPGTQGSLPRNFVGTQESVFFTASTPSDGNELYWTDGTRIKSHDIWAGASGSSPKHLTPIGSGEVLFGAYTPLGAELWRASKDKFVLVKDIQPGGHPGSRPGELIAVSRRHVLFSADDGKRGRELWRSDGTTQGTGLVDDLCFQSCSSAPGQFTRLGCEVLFTAFAPGYGAELFITDIGATSQVVGEGCSPDSRIPSLSSTDPVLNGSVTLQVGGAPTWIRRMTLVTVIGEPAVVPLPLDGCPIYIDPFQPYVTTSRTINSSQVQFSLGKVPNNPWLRCRSVTLQGLFLGKPKVETTNGLSLYFGK